MRQGLQVHDAVGLAIAAASLETSAQSLVGLPIARLQALWRPASCRLPFG